MYDMNIFQFISGVTIETFETDNQFRTGRIGAKVGKRVKITWNDTNRYEYVNLAEITKIDRESYVWDKPWDGAQSGHIAEIGR